MVQATQLQGVFDQECKISFSSFICGRNFVIQTYIWKALVSGFHFHSPKTADNKQTVLQRPFIRQGFGYPWHHLTASSAVTPLSTATRGSRTPSWTKSPLWTSLQCPSRPLRQKGSGSSGSKRVTLKRKTQASRVKLWCLPSRTGRASST